MNLKTAVFRAQQHDINTYVLCVCVCVRVCVCMCVRWVSNPISKSSENLSRFELMVKKAVIGFNKLQLCANKLQQHPGKDPFCSKGVFSRMDFGVRPDCSYTMLGRVEK